MLLRLKSGHFPASTSSPPVCHYIAIWINPPPLTVPAPEITKLPIGIVSLFHLNLNHHLRWFVIIPFPNSQSPGFQDISYRLLPSHFTSSPLLLSFTHTYEWDFPVLYSASFPHSCLAPSPWVISSTLKSSFNQTLMTSTLYLQHHPLMCSSPEFQIAFYISTCISIGTSDSTRPRVPSPTLPQQICSYSCTSHSMPFSATALPSHLWFSLALTFHKQVLTNHFNSIFKISLAFSLSPFPLSLATVLLQCFSKSNFRQYESPTELLEIPGIQSRLTWTRLSVGQGPKSLHFK